MTEQPNAAQPVPKTAQSSAANEQLAAIRQAAEQDPDCEQALADFVMNQSAGMYLAGSNQSSPLRCLTPKAFQKYFDELYAEIGCPEAKDPLHRLMVEQLVIAHHVIGRLVMNTANCQEIELLRTQCTLAVQLMSEFRRMAQAVNAYEPRQKKENVPAVSLAPHRTDEAVKRPQARGRRGAA